jgi:thiol peroxidase
MTERPNGITFKGSPMTLVGPEIKVGDTAPDFTVVGTDMSDISKDDYKGKVLVLSVAPSVDTPVCANQTRTFNEKATQLSDDVAILSVSLDLPFALKRFCAAEGIDNVAAASDYKHRQFGEAYGVYIKELGLLGRAVFVIDQDGKVAHAQYCPEVAEEPDYDAALESVKAAV